jgi:hypothetical protein
MIDVETQRYISLLGDAGVIGDPCDEWQVRNLEQQFRVTLPPAYKAFLMVAGKWFDPFEGSQYILEHDCGELQFDPAELQRAGRRIPQKDGTDLPVDALVFFLHQGVAVRFILLNDGDDPAVFEYVEHEPPAKQVAATFSEFLLGEMQASEKLKSARFGGG